MTVKNIIFQGHHPSRELFPNYKIKLRKWVHMFVRRIEQFNPTEENLIEIERIVRAITWIYNLKKMELETKEEDNVGEDNAREHNQ